MKLIVKRVVLAVCYLLVLPSGSLSRLLCRTTHSSVLFDFFAQWYALAPGLPGRLMRACYYKQTLARASLDLDIGFASFVSKMQTSIGRSVLITAHTTIGCAAIGDGAVIANHVSILSGRYQHNFTDPRAPILSGTDRFSMVHIGPGSFIGEHAVIMADVGSYAIVGAGSVVIRAIPDFVVAVGNPARVVKQRSV
jgi:virginiamycin A acetyltransferase